MIDEKKLIAKLESWESESKEESGLKEPALLQKIIEEVKDMAVNECIRRRIEQENMKGAKLIDAEHLKINLKVYFGLKINHGHRQIDTVDTNAELAELVDRQPAVSDSGWIPVSERVPDHERTVIVTAQGKRERFTALDNYVLDLKDWETFSNDDDGEVIAWMPLPEPYKGE